jgi:hypothetical protein
VEGSSSTKARQQGLQGISTNKIVLIDFERYQGLGWKVFIFVPSPTIIGFVLDFIVPS